MHWPQSQPTSFIKRAKAHIEWTLNIIRIFLLFDTIAIFTHDVWDVCGDKNEVGTKLIKCFIETELNNIINNYIVIICKLH